MREAIASAIESRGGFDDAQVLDLYAGTGAMAFEALSRGARHAVLVDADGRVARAIAKAATELDLGARSTVIAADLRTPAAIARIEAATDRPFDRIFVDPPYADVGQVGPLLTRLAARALIAPECILAIEHAKKHAPAQLDGFTVLSHKHYGDTSVLFLSPDPLEAPA